MSTDPYIHRNLTASIADKSSPLRRYLDATFPNLRPVQAEFRSSGGNLLVDTAGANPGTVGAAFDYSVRMTLDPHHVPEMAFYGFLSSPGMLAALRDLVLTMQVDATIARAEDAPDSLLRGCWALALTTEVYRIGGIPPGSALTAMPGGQPTVQALLDLAPPAALTELRALHRISQERLFAELPLAGSLALGPTFDASALCPADADLIIDGLLLDIKTHLGPKSKNGRTDALSLQDAYQLVGYALFDRSDHFDLTQVGIYSARYGHLVRWKLPTFLEVLAGRAVDIAAEREHVWTLLGGGQQEASRR